jgi:putative OPT family oligopeptide transporter
MRQHGQTDNFAPSMSATAEFSPRAVLTGILLGALLTPSNVYAGFKIGWSFNMSVIALLLGYAFWQGVVARWRHGAQWTLLESNINQTVASAAASIISGGLVAPIPALTLLTGIEMDTAPMVAWVFSVSFLGIWIAWFLRDWLLADPALRFPESVATLEALTRIYSHGREATQRVLALLGAALVSGALKWWDEFQLALPRLAPTPQLERLTFTLDPSLLLLGFGGIIGMRVGLSLLAGALLAWGGIAPWLVQHHLVKLAPKSGPQFAVFVEWLLWPGVALMVSATFASLAMRLLRQRGVVPARMPQAWGAHLAAHLRVHCLPLLALGLSIALVVLLQQSLFGIAPSMAWLTIPLALALAVVAARVVGATGIAPVGAIGQLSQLGFGLVAQGQLAVNLMGANTAGGAAGQCTDLMNDFKVGRAIGATPWKQAASQCLGIAIGSVVAVLTYKALIPDPKTMLLTEAWPAPAAATWKAVAQTLSAGLSSLAPSIRIAILAGALAGTALGILETVLPPRHAHWLPAPAALGLAFMLPASVSLMMAAGAALAWLVARCAPKLSDKYALTVAAGLVAGESMMGVAAAQWRLLLEMRG